MCLVLSECQGLKYRLEIKCRRRLISRTSLKQSSGDLSDEWTSDVSRDNSI